jgi:hypothetical protein
MAVTRLVPLILVCASCAHSRATEYGEPILPTMRHPALESAVARHDSALVTVWAQSEPATPNEPPLGRVAFRGRLAGLSDGWLRLLRNRDTVRIGIDNVRRIRLVQSNPRNRMIGALVGAAGFTLAGWAFTQVEARGSGGVLTVMGAAALGGGLGFLLVPGSRYAGQIYPTPPPPRQVPR